MQLRQLHCEESCSCMRCIEVLGKRTSEHVRHRPEPARREGTSTVLTALRELSLIYFGPQ
ncbi:hypothetical protein B0F90DRAFT_1753673 [Multifurca ochricompacta]|uniref:Uncharacterized protein n=1 Tax=Multifurca ochricompacta TaxID=376703 RepID=A0AAD4LYX0_9AGAM|nr:hypothetical protein B0F90DRAFT_1753673 [Multifurca ochricompacta]